MGHPTALAMPPGTDPLQLTRHLGRAHDAFVADGRFDPALRQVVADSWRRSVGAGLDPERSLASIRLDEARLADVRASHPLAAAMPVIRRLLVESATDAGMLVAVSDAAGQLLWVEGCPRLRSRAESMHFVPGADWSESSAGTNAPGTALALGVPVQIFGPEHLARQVTPWSCSAAPIREPDTGAILGVLDITGTAEVVTPMTLALVRATVAAAEAELRLDRMRSADGPITVVGGWSRPRMEVLGRRGGRLCHGSTATSLSLRHSEMALLLAESEDGLTAGELAIGLTEDEQAQVTIRAELSRLRRQLGGIRLGSRPYRLEVGTDLDDVRADLTASRLRQAVARYRGPVLPSSEAPGVVALREDLHRRLRSRLLDGGDPDALLAFADTPYAREDYEVWEAALSSMSLSSPRYTEVATYVAELDRTLR